MDYGLIYLQDGMKLHCQVIIKHIDFWMIFEVNNLLRICLMQFLGFVQV